MGRASNIDPAGRPYAGKSRAERRLERRGRLVRAGIECFGTVGFVDTSIETVCAKAAVGIRAFYEEFGTREDLFREVYDHVVDQVFADVGAVLEETRELSVQERFHRSLRRYLERMVGDRRWGRIVSIESAHVDHSLGAHRKETLNRFAVLATGALPAGLHPRNARLWSLVLAGGVNEVVIDLLLSPDHSSLDDAASELASLFTRTLGKEE